MFLAQQVVQSCVFSRSSHCAFQAQRLNARLLFALQAKVPQPANATTTPLKSETKVRLRPSLLSVAMYSPFELNARCVD
eukprot:2230039-Pleurochrysis_carterae.AAC.1